MHVRTDYCCPADVKTNFLIMMMFLRKYVLNTIGITVIVGLSAGVIGPTAFPETVRAADVTDFDTVIELVGAWRDAWQERNIERYLFFYSRDFTGDEHDRHGWEDAKRAVFTTGEPFSVEVLSPCLSSRDDNVAVTFLERYYSPSLCDAREKTLLWTREQSSWKIISEDSRLPSVTNGASVRWAAEPGTGIAVRHIAGVVTDIPVRAEGVSVTLSPFSRPQIAAIERETPCVIAELTGVDRWCGPPLIPLSGSFVKRIHAYLYEGCQTLRIAIELTPLERYAVNPLYGTEESRFILQIIKNSHGGDEG